MCKSVNIFVFRSFQCCPRALSTVCVGGNHMIYPLGEFASILLFLLQQRAQTELVLFVDNKASGIGTMVVGRCSFNSE